MKRREFITLIGGAAAAWPLAARAQQRPNLPRVGYIFSQTEATGRHLWEACRQGLRELGYVEGQNIILDVYWVAGQYEQLSDRLAELERLKVDVLVLQATPANLAAKGRTSEIPVVFVAVADPLRIGLIASLSRPAGRFTGLSLLTTDISGKRLELLAEAVPNLSRVAVLFNPRNPNNFNFLEETQAAAQKLRIEMQSFGVSNPEQLEPAVETAIGKGVTALNVIDDPWIHSQRERIVALAANHRLPAIYGIRDFADEGGLMAYGPNRPDQFHRSAIFVDKILKGSKPADLPVEQPTKFELIVNLKTARALGLDIPATVLARADEVIE
jgi:putative ABC transport system substrate-binding protein